MEPDKLARLKEYGEFILRKIDSVPQRPSQEEDWVPTSLDDCLLRLREAAENTVKLATSPVKIGVMGEFSSGKSLLLGSLIGYADALPVSENPTTGNVTAIHVKPQDGFATTQVNNYTVEYLSHEGVNECLHFMLKEANRRATSAGVTPLQVVKIKTGKDISIWCEEVWKSSNNLELRYLVRELLSFLRAYQAYGEALCGRFYQIDAITAREGLQLAEMPMAIQSLKFEDLPAAPIRLPNAPQRLGTQLLQTSFLLIRRVDIEVKISREIWDVTGAEEFVLLDFPGLGAANSGTRDTFLSLRELTQVQTILVLLNGKSPGSDRANKIFTMMQQKRPGQDLKDLILVGVGRFDQLPLESEGGERELDLLIANQSNLQPLQTNTVFQKLKVLKTIIDGAEAFTSQKDRIVLLSPLLGLAELAKRSSQVKAGSEEFLANLDYPDYLERPKKLQQKWGDLSEGLLAVDGRNQLGKQLGYFAQDGGISKLRELIQTHVANHGLKQLYEDSRRAADVIRQQQEYLKEIIAEIHEQGIPTVDTPALMELRLAIESLDKIYRNFQKGLGKEQLKDRRGIVVSDVIKDELTLRILNWSQWTLLFNKVQNGTITLAEFKGAAGKLFDRGNRVNTSLPTKSDDFYPAFEKTVKELETFASDRIRQAVIDLLSSMAHQITLEREKLQAILQPEMEQEIEEKFGLEEADLFYKLLLGCDPRQWKEAIIAEINNHDQSIKPESIFPLAKQDEKHSIGQIFDWSPERNQNPSRSTNHQLFVLRLRDEITASASLHLVQYVSESNQQVNIEINGILDQIIPSLQNLAKKETLLRYIAARDSQAELAIPAWLEILTDIATINEAELFSYI
ncbi:dynamin family protein [Dolichospermum sp. ST_con]|nr:dynamin family protein [Dolichospermum sp. ST_con]MDD1418978.1 dynamin family protein [Dolichospermum sp. ST_sed1]MDD1423310.1 dynamin family protein [Dolichospermum sp. ST_sed9]MDD1431229.1 dynamin family protein [Dolichospermum sp. ST_sed6]MDD1435351.1 dynamin family protein [Dolichospermum sp. ST_sed10]MDD1441301.1 dynamin family protein [Dolichospermum sp. ST_sed3]MDD1445022.1 dynamin family protein [Dolichospermum sp. ST_sed8]MDD1454670.1 dynamin family protein [Dolichospermum sp. ST